MTRQDRLHRRQPAHSSRHRRRVGAAAHRRSRGQRHPARAEFRCRDAKNNVVGLFAGAGFDWQFGRVALFASGEATSMSDDTTSFAGKGRAVSAQSGRRAAPSSTLTTVVMPGPGFDVATVRRAPTRALRLRER